MEKLDALFIIWEKRHLETGHKRFIRDGIVNEEWWMQEQRVPKVCYFLKEARTEQEQGYNLVKDLYEYEPWKLWKKVAIWTQAIQLAFTGERSYDYGKIEMKSHEAIRQIAVVNVKKSDGLAGSSEEDLWNYVKMDKDLLKQELEIINADVIVCGYTFGMLCKVLEDEIEMEGTVDTMYAFWRDKLIIDYYHPACHFPNRVNYYALMSICRLAADEWEERKIRYAGKTDSSVGAD